ncbi:MAG: hypothetical protein IRZ00_11845 [Gemmatimonadetes bacterium]|nr:hypothetical protein [Gemmatimonadota bacterium]
MAAKRVPAELLSDTEATLRLVDHLVSELAPSRPSAPHWGDEPAPDDAATVRLPDRAYTEIVAVVDALQQGRDAVRRLAAERRHGSARPDDLTADHLARAAAFLADLENRLTAVLADARPPL